MDISKFCKNAAGNRAETLLRDLEASGGITSFSNSGFNSRIMTAEDEAPKPHPSPNQADLFGTSLSSNPRITPRR